MMIILKKIFRALEPKKINNQKIFFNGEIYDAYSLIIDLIKEVNSRINKIEDKDYLDKLLSKFYNEKLSF